MKYLEIGNNFRAKKNIILNDKLLVECGEVYWCVGKAIYVSAPYHDHFLMYDTKAHSTKAIVISISKFDENWELIY